MIVFISLRIFVVTVVSASFTGGFEWKMKSIEVTCIYIRGILDYHFYVFSHPE
jgi:hypothetical protein